MCNPQEEDLEAQVSFLQGQINDLEAMSKYCAKMMNTHICERTPSNLHVETCLRIEESVLLGAFLDESNMLPLKPPVDLE